MAIIPDVKVAYGPANEIYLLGGSPAVEQWDDLGVVAKARLDSRFKLICTATDLLDDRKIRKVSGSDQVYEIKIKKPPLRAFAFRDGSLRITHIESKPSKSRVLDEARKCERIRNEYWKRKAEHGTKNPTRKTT